LGCLCCARGRRRGERARAGNGRGNFAIPTLRPGRRQCQANPPCLEEKIGRSGTTSSAANSWTNSGDNGRSGKPNLHNMVVHQHFRWHFGKCSSTKHRRRVMSRKTFPVVTEMVTSAAGSGQLLQSYWAAELAGLQRSSTSAPSPDRGRPGPTGPSPAAPPTEPLSPPGGSVARPGHLELRRHRAQRGHRCGAGSSAPRDPDRAGHVARP